MQLSSRCYGLTGLTHADYFSVNAGFIVGNQETVVIDAGYNVEAAQTIHGYAKAAAPVNKISHVILLEGHYDHILGTSYFVEQGAQTVVHPSVTLKQQEIDKLKREANDELPFERRRKNKEAYLYFEGVKPFAPEVKVAEDTSLAIEGIDIEIYLAPGHTEENLLVFEESTMTHPIYRVIGFEIVGSYTLWIDFDDGTKQIIDFRPVLEGALYEPLQDESVFNQVEIDPEVHTLVWPNGPDFDPATLHDWPKYAAEMKRMAKQWAEVKAKTDE